MRGINVGVAAMLTFTVVNFFKKSIKDSFGIVVFAIAFAMLFLPNINTIWVIVFGVTAGLIKTAFLHNKMEAQK